MIYLFAGLNTDSLTFIGLHSISGLYVFILIAISINAMINTIPNKIKNPFNSYPLA